VLRRPQVDPVPVELESGELLLSFAGGLLSCEELLSGEDGVLLDELVPLLDPTPPGLLAAPVEESCCTP